MGARPSSAIAPVQPHRIQTKKHHAEDHLHSENPKEPHPGDEEAKHSASPPQRCDRPLHGPAQNDGARSMGHADDHEDGGEIPRAASMVSEDSGETVENKSGAHHAPDGPYRAALGVRVAQSAGPATQAKPGKL